MTHIALLRAVNLGAHNKIGMADLKALLVGLGFEDVQTLLQSGNVVFSGGSKTTAALEQTLERAAAKQLGLETDFFVRTAKEWQAVIDANPVSARGQGRPEPSPCRDHEGPGGPGERDGAAESDRRPGSRAREGPLRLHRLSRRHRPLEADERVIEKKLGTRGTARNWNTVLKLPLALRRGGSLDPPERPV